MKGNFVLNIGLDRARNFLSEHRACSAQLKKKGNSRVGSVDRCHEIAQIGKEQDVFFTTGSDAHFCHDVGNLDLVGELMDRVGIKSEKVITTSVEQFLSFLELRGRDSIAEYDEMRKA